MDLHLVIDRGGSLDWGFSPPAAPAPAPAPTVGEWELVSRINGQREIVWPDSAAAAPTPAPPPTVGEWELVTRIGGQREIAWDDAPPSTALPGSITSVTLQLVSPTAAARSGLSGLKWAFYDSADFPANLAAGPVDTGVGSTNGSGAIVILLPSSTLTAGQTGWLIITNSDGTATQSPPSMAFCAPVVVA